MHVHDVGFFNQNAAGGRIAVGGASRKKAEGCAFGGREGGIRGGRSRKGYRTYLLEARPMFLQSSKGPANG